MFASVPHNLYPLHERIRQNNLECIVNKSGLVKLIAIFVLSTAWALAQSQPASPNAASAEPAPRRVQVDADTASTMIVQRAPLAYPEAAFKAGIHGKVVLKVVTSYSGDVKEVTVVSGDPALAQAAVDAVKQRKYKPYLADGLPAEMETQVSFDFQIKAPPQQPPTTVEPSRTPVRERVAMGVMTGLLIKKVQPVYPSEAKNARVQGQVTLQARINKSGDIVDLQVVSGHPLLAPSAIKAVRKWKYHPYLLNGEPVEVDTMIVVNYNLTGF